MLFKPPLTGPFCQHDSCTDLNPCTPHPLPPPHPTSCAHSQQHQAQGGLRPLVSPVARIPVVCLPAREPTAPTTTTTTVTVVWTPRLMDCETSIYNCLLRPLQHKRGWRLNQLLKRLQPHGPHGPIHHSVVTGQSHAHHAILLRGPHRQNAGLRGVDDRGELLDAEGPQVADRESAPDVLLWREASLSGQPGQLFDVAADLLQPLGIGVVHHGCEQPRGGGHGDTHIHDLVLPDLVPMPLAVDRRHLFARQRSCFHDEIVDTDLVFTVLCSGVQRLDHVLHVAGGAVDGQVEVRDLHFACSQLAGDDLAHHTGGCLLVLCRDTRSTSSTSFSGCWGDALALHELIHILLSDTTAGSTSTDVLGNHGHGRRGSTHPCGSVWLNTRK
mmetsp:Transcript_72220/g.120888  ORF Transcript_72220/g.120888 Transcript_72220/m.120888 type:complete len:385 (-) Transcript_72220:467-1621(-)